MRILYFVLYLNFISINCSNKLLDLCSCKRSLYLHIDCIIIADTLSQNKFQLYNKKPEKK